VGTADNFFDLGGNSLLAIRMFDQVYRQMGRKLPLTTLFQHPTIAQLAGQLEKQDTGRWETVIDIQPRGTRPPLFFVHGFGGGVLGYQELARRMGPDQPFLGIIARGLDGQDPPHQEIVEMAQFYLDAIRKIQPHGPYYLGGYCFGGVVAFEMARQLQAAGEETRLVAVLEGFAPIHEEKPLGWWHPKILGNFILNLPYWLADFWKLGWGQMRLRAARKARAGWLRLRSRLGLPVEVDLTSIIEDVSGIPEDHQRLMEIHVRAMMRYRPPVSDIPVTVFRVRAQSLFGRHDEDNGWGRLAGAVEVRMIEGAHRNILEMPHVATLADELNAVLDNLFAKGANHGK
jgi:thioesterase domain-containing protein